MNIRKLKLVVGGCLLACHSMVSAVIFEPGVGLGWQYSDNVALREDDTDADWGAVAYLGGSLSEDGGPLTYSADGTLTYQRYAEKTFDDTTYFNLGARLNWAQIAGRLNWLVDDFFTQTPINSIGRDVPTNIQDSNVFSITSSIAFPFSSGHSIQLTPFFRDFYYEESNTDNQQYGLGAGWSYPVYPTMRLGVNGTITDVNYEDSDAISDYTTSSLQAVVSGTRARSNYTLSFGASRINRDQGSDQSGFSGSASYLYNFTGHSSIRTFVSSSLTDSSQTFFNSEITPDDGNSNNVQISGETFRDTVLTVTYVRNDDTFNTRVYAELRDVDYEEALSDRQVQDLGADFDYTVNPYITTGVFGSYTRFKETDANRTDKRYILGGRATYNFSRKLKANVTLQYRDRTSTRAGFDYDEFSALVGVVYGFVGKTTGLAGDSGKRF